jgi:signal transduction histidine kinase
MCRLDTRSPFGDNPLGVEGNGMEDESGGVRPKASPFYCFAVGIAPEEGAERAAAARLEELVERNRWLVRLRWLAALGLVAATSLAAYAFRMPVPAAVLYSLAAFLALYNAVVYFVTKPSTGPRDVSGSMSRATMLAVGQIVVDLVTLTALLHFSGGIENPFFLYFTFHMVIASILLSRAASFHIASFAIALFFSLVLAERFAVLRHYPLWNTPLALYEDPAYIFAVLAVFATTMYLAVYFAGDIVERMRSRSRELISTTTSLEKGTLELQEAYEKIRALEATKSDFLRTAAHQLRSPLSAMRSLLDVVVEGFAKDPARQSEMLSRARERTDLMIAMVSDLLTLSTLKDAAAAIIPHEERVDGCRIMEELEAFYRPRAGARKVRLTIQPPPNYCIILAAPDDLRQVLNNLLDNAISYTGEGGAVTCRAELADDRVRISVSDTGIGIPADAREHIFEEFYRAPNAKAAVSHGTGLGLAIVKRIVERWHGTISVESEVGRGTTFTLVFPIAAVVRP